MRHSPGPWKCKFRKNCDWSIYDKNGYSVLAIPHDDQYGRPYEDEANARLVTAAPDLLKALKDMVIEMAEQDIVGYLDESAESFKMLTKRLANAEKAIRKAGDTI